VRSLTIVSAPIDAFVVVVVAAAVARRRCAKNLVILRVTIRK
jgi:hypothetical protein